MHPYVRMCATSGGTPVRACVGDMLLKFPSVGILFSMYAECLKASGHSDLCRLDCI